jgi:hypothetical protein
LATEEIRGLSVKFDADFSEFKKNLRNADKDINSTQKQLKSLQESLKLEWDPKKFQRAQQEAQKALKATEQKADLLRQRMLQIEEAGVTDKNRAEYNYLAEQLERTELNAAQLRHTLEELDEIRLKNLTKGLDDAAGKLDKAAQKTRAISTAAAAAVGGLVALGLSAVEQADNIATLATKYDMSTDAIQRFNYVALQTDTQAEELYKAFVKVRGGVTDLQLGISSVSTAALHQLGLEFDKFSGKEEQFYAIIDALANMEDQTKMVSLATDIFGEEMATNLFPLIYSGTDAINEYKQEFEGMGALTEDQIQQLAEFDNVLNNLKTQYTNLGLTLGESLLPLLEEFSHIATNDILPILRDMVDWFTNLDDGQQKALISLLLLTAAISPFLSVASKAVSGISGLIQILAKLDAATLAAVGKWALLTAAVGSLMAVISNWSNMNAVQRIIGLLGSLSAAALAAAVAFGVFHASWSVGIAVAGIIAGIAAATAAVMAASKDIGVQASFDASTREYTPYIYNPSDYTPRSPTSSSTVNNATNNYQDNSVVNITIEKNEYMSEEEIIQAVNKGLKLAKQSRA